MGNHLRGEVDLVVGDKTYVLRLSTNELATTEDLLDCSITGIGEMLSDARTLRLGTIRALLFAGLHSAQPTLSLEDAGEIIGEIGIPAALEKIGESMKASFPDPVPDENPQTASPAGTGEDSSSTLSPRASRKASTGR